MTKVLDMIMDAIDLETFIVCKNSDEAEKLMKTLMEGMGFKDISMVFIEHRGPGARIRARGYIHRPGDRYGWLFNESFRKGEC